jgi:fluoroquinolone resistance protein
MNSIQDQTFTNIDFVTSLPIATEYEACEFVACNFAKATLSSFHFVDCMFTNCDLSNAKLTKTTLNDIKFSGCKLLGLHFNECSDFLFAVSFADCNLSFSSFYQRTVKKTSFRNCILQEVDFTEANLSGSAFDGCDLNKALFENSVLEKVDFRSAYNYIINPEQNKMKKSRFSNAGLAGLLAKYDLDIS